MIKTGDNINHTFLKYKHGNKEFFDPSLKINQLNPASRNRVKSMVGNTTLEFFQDANPFTLYSQLSSRVMACIPRKTALSCILNFFTPNILCFGQSGSDCGDERNGWPVSCWIDTGRFEAAMDKQRKDT
jgi:hypothetical protein